MKQFLFLCLLLSAQVFATDYTRFLGDNSLTLSNKDTATDAAGQTYRFR